MKLVVKYKRGHLYYPEIPIHKVLEETAKRFPDRPAFLYPKNMTYKQFRNQVDIFATALKNLGVKKGDRVALYGPNSIQWEISFLGLERAGAILVPMNPLFKETEVEYEANDSGAETIIVSQPEYPNVAAVKDKTNIKNIIVIGSGEKPEGTLGWSELIANTKPDPPEYNFDPKEDLAALVYTSGTTGLPKGTMLTHYNIVSNVIQISQIFELSELDIAMTVLPLYHIYGLNVCMNQTLWLGAAQVVTPRFEVKEFCELIEKYQVTYSLCVPPIFLAVVRHLEDPNIKGYDWTNLKIFNNGAAPIPLELLERFDKLAKEKCDAKEIIIQHGWGLTEASPVVAVNPMYRPKMESQGTLIPDTFHKIIDLETGEELPERGQVGELVIKGPQVMKGYWKKPEATRDAFWIDPKTGEKWLRTGDMAYIDEDEYQHLLDRIKEMIKYKGWSIAPAELEDLLFKNPHVFDVAVIGKPSKELDVGEIPKAFIILNPESKGKVTEDEIMKWVAEKISAYKKIREVEFVDNIPKSGSGKILRRELVQQEKNKLGIE
ncbi:MAG: 4-coumarate--CoA ligase family protein [Promethearchaeota archaeon Loki_b32]|nr:MAG: 4-coumarate--CoA ligase family protein [Candidatus Lokiarchaeota archaeon Loki_b32]